MSRAIQRLEEEVGQPLFFRDNRSLTLTPAGELFREYADHTLQGWQELAGRLAAAEIPGGRLRLYCSVTAAYTILPDLLGRFRGAHPRVHLHLQTGDAAQALAQFRNDEADVAVAALPGRLPAGLTFLELVQTPLLFIAAAAFPAAVVYRKKKIDWQETPLIMPERGLSRRRLERWLAEEGVAPNIYAEVAGNEALIAMVGLGCGVGVVPQLVLEKSPLREQIQVLEAAPSLAPYSVGLCTPTRNLANPVVRTFWDCAEEGRGGPAGSAPPQDGAFEGADGSPGAG